MQNVIKTSSDGIIRGVCGEWLGGWETGARGCGSLRKGSQKWPP